MPQDNPYSLYRPQIIDATAKGRVTDWVERIAEIALSTGLDRSRIDWSGSPDVVAHNVIDAAKRAAKLPALEQAIARYRADHPHAEATA